MRPMPVSVNLYNKLVMSTPLTGCTHLTLLITVLIEAINNSLFNYTNPSTISLVPELLLWL